MGQVELGTAAEEVLDEAAPADDELAVPDKVTTGTDVITVMTENEALVVAGLDEVTTGTDVLTVVTENEALVVAGPDELAVAVKVTTVMTETEAEEVVGL